MESYLEDTRPTLDELCMEYDECTEECPAYEFCHSKIESEGEMESRITGRVEEWWKSVCQKHNCKYYIHEDYPKCSYCTCPDNCIVVKEHKVESEDKK